MGLKDLNPSRGVVGEFHSLDGRKSACIHCLERGRGGSARIAHSLDVGLLSILLRHALLLLPARQSKAKISRERQEGMELSHLPSQNEWSSLISRVRMYGALLS